MKRIATISLSLFISVTTIAAQGLVDQIAAVKKHVRPLPAITLAKT